MHSRKFLACLVLATALTRSPPGLAQECSWPQPLAPSPAAAEAALPETERPFEITSADAELSRGGDAELSGGVVVRQGSRELRAESVAFAAAPQRFDVEGAVEFRAPDLRLKAEGGSWSTGGGGRFTGTEFELPARPARGSAAELAIRPEGELALREVGYTTCPAGNEDWFLRAAAIDIDQRRQLGTGRNVRVELKGVPILYLPWISFPVGSARKSGFLFPSFGTSEKSGFELGIPYYFNLAPNYDLTLTPRLLTRRGPGLDGRFRYLTPRSSGRLETVLLPDDRVAGRERGFGHLSHRTDFATGLRFEVNAEHASDSRYFEDFGLGPDGTSVMYLERRLSLAWQGESWRFDGRLQHFQTIEQSIQAEDRPYARLPQLLFSGRWPLAGGGLTAGIDSELTWFERNAGATGLRLDLAPGLAWRLGGPGWHLEPGAGYRYTAWELDDVAPGAETSPHRGAPVLSLDAGLVLARALGRDRPLQQTLEPRLRYAWIPYRDQDSLPLFDTGLPDLSLLQLFRSNRYVGADRLGDANELAVGLTTRFVDARTGARFLSATLGQRYFFERPRVRLPGERPETRNASSVIGELEAGPWRKWSVRVAMEWDADASNTVRGQAGVQFRPRHDTVVNAGYRYREGLLEQWEASLAWRLNPRWQVFARQVYSLRADTTIDSLAGLEYGSCCWRIRLVGRRYVSNRTGQQDTAILLQLELKGLSSVGTSDDTFLRRHIRGYSPDPADSLP